MAERLLAQLTRDGVVRLPSLLTGAQLRSMQEAFAARLQRLSWNDVMGYERTERYRHMIQDVLILDQGILDVAIHPIVQEVLRAYLGSQYQLVEAKGWLSLPTRRDFHGWHGDAWYDQRTVRNIPKEIKLALYLTDVKSGAFSYIKGSHQKQHPRLIPSRELVDTPREVIEEVTGPAGSAFLFDTSGIHRQSMPVLEPRQAIFLNYHDPAVPLQAEDVAYYRYHPLILNAAFLGNLSEEDRRVLGFGDKRNYQHGFVRQRRHPFLESVNRSLVELNIRFNSALYYPRRALAKVQGAFARG
jgi:hypothetical protein